MNITIRSLGSLRRQTRRVASVCLGVALCATLALPTRGADSPAAPSDNGPLRPPPGPFSAGGDETVGTLPVIGGGNVLDTLRIAKLTRPALYIEGSLNEVFGALVASAGDPSAMVQPLGDGTYRMYLLGDVELAFDQRRFAESKLNIGIGIPSSAKPIPAMVEWAPRGTQTIALPSGDSRLPIAELNASNALRLAPLNMRLDAVDGLRCSARLMGDSLMLRQAR